MRCARPTLRLTLYPNLTSATLQTRAHRRTPNLSQARKDLGAFAVLFWIDAVILLILIPWGLANGELVALVRSPKNPYQWAQLVGTAVLGGARFFSQLLVLKFHPASSLAVANLGMQALNMYLAIWLFGTPALTPHVVGGSVLALAMAALYSYFKWSRVLERGACSRCTRTSGSAARCRA